MKGWNFLREIIVGSLWSSLELCGCQLRNILTYLLITWYFVGWYICVRITSFCLSLDCHDFSRHELLWAHPKHSALCWQVGTYLSSTPSHTFPSIHLCSRISFMCFLLLVTLCRQFLEWRPSWQAFSIVSFLFVTSLLFCWRSFLLISTLSDSCSFICYVTQFVIGVLVSPWITPWHSQSIYQPKPFLTHRRSYRTWRLSSSSS